MRADHNVNQSFFEVFQRFFLFCCRAETAEQSGAFCTAAQESETALTGKVHLNTATAEELETLPGVGAVTAQRIVEYRSAHGFARIEDLMNVKGIGQAKFKKMQTWLDL